jgi:hypothetical protein
MNYQSVRLPRNWQAWSVLFILSMIIYSCYGVPDLLTKVDDGPNDLFVAVAPPSTPLVCPDQHSDDQNNFVVKNGTSFAYRGTSIAFYGYTFYPALIGGASAWHTTAFTHYIDHIMDMGNQLGQNLIRPTDFWDQNDPHPVQSSKSIWANVDYLVCAAQKRNIFVDLDLSAFQKVLISQHLDDFNPDNWRAFLTAVGQHYSNQSSIAFYSIVGEPPVPTNSAEMNKLINFYRVTTDTLHQADQHHLITAGGFNHMEQETAGFPWWQSIDSLPNNDIVAFKTYSLDDLHLIPKIADFAQTIGKPAFDEEFGMPQSLGDAAFAGGEGILGVQTSRAQFYQDVYSLGEQARVKGFVFWNLGCGLRSDSYEVNPQTPATWQVVELHGPDKQGSSTVNQSFCS